MPPAWAIPVHLSVMVVSGARHVSEFTVTFYPPRTTPLNECNKHPTNQRKWDSTSNFSGMHPILKYTPLALLASAATLYAADSRADDERHHHDEPRHQRPSQPAPQPSQTNTASAGASSSVSGVSPSSSISDASRSYSVAFSPAAMAAALPAIRCKSESSAWGLGWNFVSHSGSVTDQDGLCQAVDLAGWLYKTCQFRASASILKGVLTKVYGSDVGDSISLDGVENLPAEQCASAPLLRQAAEPAPPAPAPPAPTAPPKRVTLKASTLFATGSATPGPGFTRAMDALRAEIGSSDVERVLVRGHADSTGSEPANLTLSGKRAAMVRSALIARGVRESLITTESVGSAEPIASNDTADGRAQNRRVEVVIDALQ